MQYDRPSSAPASDPPYELFMMLGFDRHGVPTGIELVEGDATGLRLSLDRQVDRLAAADTRMVIISHNHPSGNPNPSKADLNGTRAIARLLKRAGMSLIDHVIWTEETHFSFRCNDLLDLPKKADLGACIAESPPL